MESPSASSLESIDLLQQDELQSLSLSAIVSHSIQIPRLAPRTFSLLTLTLVFPLSFAVLAHSLLTHPLLLRLEFAAPSAAHDLLLLLLYQLLYLLFLFLFSLLSTAAVVFSVASLYTSKPLTINSALSAVPTIIPRLFLTFLSVAAIIFAYNSAFAAAFTLLFSLSDDTDSAPFILAFFALLILFLLLHVHISAVWHLAAVVSVLEPLRGLAAMRKARELLRGRTLAASILVVVYLGACGIIGMLFRMIVVEGPEDEEGAEAGVWTKIVFGGALVAMLVVVNLIGLLVQSVFYYVCKSHHHQGIDKRVLYDHLGGYLGEYVPLQSSIQMENL